MMIKRTKNLMYLDRYELACSRRVPSTRSCEKLFLFEKREQTILYEAVMANRGRESTYTSKIRPTVVRDDIAHRTKDSLIARVAYSSGYLEIRTPLSADEHQLKEHSSNATTRPITNTGKSAPAYRNLDRYTNPSRGRIPPTRTFDSVQF